MTIERGLISLPPHKDQRGNDCDGLGQVSGKLRDFNNPNDKGTLMGGCTSSMCYKLYKVDATGTLIEHED